MSRPVPRIRGFSVVVPAGVHVDAYDAWLLGRVFSAAARPNLDAFLWQAGLVREDRERMISLVDGFVNLGAEWGAGAHVAQQRRLAEEEVTSAEAGLRLGVTTQRVGQLVREGRLEGRSSGGRLRVTRASVEALRSERAGDAETA